MNERFYISFKNDEDQIFRTKIIFMIHSIKDKNEYWYLMEEFAPVWKKSGDISKEKYFYPISESVFYKLKNLNYEKRYKINKSMFTKSTDIYIYYSDLFKNWKVFDELIEYFI